MKVLLISAKMAETIPWTPIGLASIAAYLQKHDIEVKIIDNNFIELNKEKLSGIFGEIKPDIVGISGMTVQAHAALKIGALVKEIDKNLTLVYGGVHFTFMPNDGLKYGDICVIGEGEETFLEICKENDIKNIKGIAYKESNEIIINKEREFIKNLDEIPIPAYNLLEMDRYTDHLITSERAISILTGRGCPYNCSFCASPQLWKRKVRFHSLDYILSHLNYLIQNYNLKNLRIMDDTFTVQRQRILDFCEMIEENKLKLNMTCLTNVKNADLELFKRMKSVGFSIVAFGVESSNPHILKLINKGITIEEVKRAVLMAKKAGLKTELLFMIGNIGETKESIFDSINFARKLNPPSSNRRKPRLPIYPYHFQFNEFQFATPFPGSKFYYNAKDYGVVITKNWDKYTHHEPVFIPKDLDKETMIKLRRVAMNKTNASIPPFYNLIAKLVRNGKFLRKIRNKYIKVLRL